jgi:UDP-N-acetylglucosamine 4-epimerase
VIQAVCLAVDTEKNDAVNQTYNVACGGRMTLNELFESLRQNLAIFDPAISDVVPQYGATRTGDIPHSLADISKAEQLLGYKPEFSAAQGIAETAKWYFDNL